MNPLLSEQFAISWGLAAYYLPALTDEIALWEPSPRVVTVRESGGRWRAEMPDESSEPVPDTTVAWVLWHIEWWWTNAVVGVDGQPPVAHDRFPWSGSVESSTKLITELHDQWQDLLQKTAPDHPCLAPFPQPQPFEKVAAWLNVELMKNAAELGQTVRLFHNRAAGDRPAQPNGQPSD